MYGFNLAAPVCLVAVFWQNRRLSYCQQHCRLFELVLFVSAKPREAEIRSHGVQIISIIEGIRLRRSRIAFLCLGQGTEKTAACIAIVESLDPTLSMSPSS
eukprot:TRINITY_DN13200_c0_g1_i3.p1 TRINITY_DN13200_c0_g1~~TRINITY_DN13200_c0_g1_i3.p1  ORF type:complete len:101 (-),score=9.34 TRINITY_DN13200_c0_g1_i3:239-541(-)